MDLSPKAPRRFSRWQTTKRPFNFGGASSKPPSTIPELQDDHNKSKVSKEKARKVNDGKNDKTQKNSLNHPNTDSAPKQPPHISSSVKRSAVARRLCLNTSKKTESKNEAKQPEPSYGGPNISALDEKRLHQNAVSVSADKRDIFLATNEPFPHMLPKQHARQDDGSISSETAHHNSKCALSSISQNASANKPTKTHLPQGKVDISLNCAAQNEAGALTGGTNKRNRPAIEDEELSSTSGTDKENKDNDPAVPPVIKKLKLDGTLHSLSTSKPNGLLIENMNDSQDDTTISKQNIEGEVLGARMSSLRNRSLLTSPKTLLKKRQYPVFHSSKKKSESRKDSSSGKDNSCTSTESSFTKKVANRRVSPVSEIKSKQQHIKKTSPQKTSAYKDRSKNKVNSSNSSSLELKNQSKNKGNSSNSSSLDLKNQSKNKGYSSNSSSLELKNQSIPLHTNKTQNISETAATKRVAIPKEKQVNRVESNQSRSSSVRGGLRDRRSLPTPEEVQQKRQYPISFYLSSKKSSENSANSNTSREVAAKRKQSIKSTSSLDKTEFSVVQSMTSSKHEALESSKNKIGNKNNSRFEVSTIDNQVSSKKHSQLITKSRKMLNSTHITETATVDVGNTSKRLHAGSNVKHMDKTDKQSSIKQHLKANYSQELDDLALTRGPSKKSSNSKHSFSSTAEKCPESFATTDVSVRLTQLPATIVDASWKRTQKIAQKRNTSQNKATAEVNSVQTTSTKLATVRSPKVSVSDIVVVNQKQHKKGKLEAATSQLKHSLSTHGTDVPNSISQKNEQKSSKAKTRKKKAAKPQTESRTTCSSPGKLPILKADKLCYSLPRQPLSKPSNYEHSFSPSYEGSTSFATVDVFVQLPQSPETAAGTSHKPQKRVTHKEPLPQPNDKRSKVRAVGTKLATGTSVGEQINESVVVATKHPRKRKLVEEIARAEEAAEQTTDNEVVLWCEDGPSGRRSDVTAYDVILQAMIDEEDKMLDEAEEGSIEYRAVKKVMSRFRNNIKPMASKVKEVNNLKSDIRQQKSRIKKLMADIKEQQKMAQLSRENHSEQDSDQDVQMARYKDIMRGYSRLIDLFVARS